MLDRFYIISGKQRLVWQLRWKAVLAKMRGESCFLFPHCHRTMSWIPFVILWERTVVKFYIIAQIVADANAFFSGKWRELCGRTLVSSRSWNAEICIVWWARVTWQGKRLSQYLELTWATGDSVFIYDRSAEIMMHVFAFQKQQVRDTFSFTKLMAAFYVDFYWI